MEEDSTPDEQERVIIKYYTAGHTNLAFYLGKRLDVTEPLLFCPCKAPDVEKVQSGLPIQLQGHAQADLVGAQGLNRDKDLTQLETWHWYNDLTMCVGVDGS